MSATRTQQPLKVELPGNLKEIFEDKNAREGGRGSLEAKSHSTARLDSSTKGEV